VQDNKNHKTFVPWITNKSVTEEYTSDLERHAQKEREKVTHTTKKKDEKVQKSPEKR
jgi:hypothetical protein